MEEKRTSSAVWIAAIVMLLALPGAYVAGYYLRCEAHEMSVVPGRYYLVRMYPTRFEEQIFEPATKIEAALRNQTVLILRRWHDD